MKKQMIFGLIALATFLMPGCAMRGSIRDAMNRPPGQMADLSDETLEAAYEQAQQPHIWSEMERRGLVRPLMRRAIDAHEIQIGMTIDEVRASWGAMIMLNRTQTKAGDLTQWKVIRVCDTAACKIMTVMISKLVYTERGIVTAIQD